MCPNRGSSDRSNMTDSSADRSTTAGGDIVSVSQGGISRNTRNNAHNLNNNPPSGIGRSLLAHRLSTGGSTDDLKGLSTSGHHPAFQTAEPTPLHLDAPVQGLRRVPRAHGTLTLGQHAEKSKSSMRRSSSNIRVALTGSTTQHEEKRGVDGRDRTSSDSSFRPGGSELVSAVPPRIDTTTLLADTRSAQPTSHQLHPQPHHARVLSTLGPLPTFQDLNLGSSIRERSISDVAPDALGEHGTQGQDRNGDSRVVGSALRARRIVSFDFSGGAEAASRGNSIQSLVSQGWGWFMPLSGRLSGALSGGAGSALSGAFNSAIGKLEQTWAGSSMSGSGVELGGGGGGGVDARRNGVSNRHDRHGESIDGAGGTDANNDTNVASAASTRGRYRGSTHSADSFTDEYDYEEDSDHYDSHDDAVFSADEDEPPPAFHDDDCDHDVDDESGQGATQFSFQNGGERLTFNFE